MQHLRRVGSFHLSLALAGSASQPCQDCTLIRERECRTVHRNESDPFNDLSSNDLPTKANKINANKGCQCPKPSPDQEEGDHFFYVME